MNRISVKTAFSLTDRGYVIAGEILEGNIKTGMFVNYPTKSSIVKLEIEAVEFIDNVSGNGISYPAFVLSQKSVDTFGIGNEGVWLGKIFECSEI